MGKFIKIFIIMVWLVGVSSLSYYYATYVVDNDIWFHIRYGYHYVSNMTLDIDHAVYSWTPAHNEIVYGTWIGSILMYLSYSYLNTWGPYLLLWLCILIVIVLYFMSVKLYRSQVGLLHLLILLLSMISAYISINIVKPDNISFMFFAITVFIYMLWKIGHTKIIFAYPLLFLVWVNTHGTFLLVYGFLVVLVIAEFINYYLGKSKEQTFSEYKLLAISIILSFLICIINPTGLSYPTTIFTNLFGIKEEITGKLLAYMSMWDYLFEKDIGRSLLFVITAWVLLCMFFLVFFVSIYSYIRQRKLDISLILLHIFMFFYCMSTSRTIYLYSVFWLFTIPYLYKKSGLNMSINSAFWGALILCISIMIIFVNVISMSPMWRERFIDFFPEKETLFIKENKLPGPIFNFYDEGGYLLWALYPEYKVFHDVRYFPYDKEFNKLILSIDSKEKLKFVLQRYQPNIALIPHKNKTYMVYFTSDAEWKLVYFDKQAAVFIRENLFESLASHIKSVDFSTGRFSEIKNPNQLIELFGFYLRYKKIGQAMEILEIFKRNISDLFFKKDVAMQQMKGLLMKQIRLMGNQSTWK